MSVGSEIGEGRNSIDVAQLLQIIKQLVDAFIKPRIRLDLNADDVLRLTVWLAKELAETFAGRGFEGSWAPSRAAEPDDKAPASCMNRRRLTSSFIDYPPRCEIFQLSLGHSILQSEG
jgi:hypothetical protein